MKLAGYLVDRLMSFR